MKIIHICLCGPVTDGWAYQENLLSKYHKKLGFDVFLITSDLMWGNDGRLTRSKEKDYINTDGVRMIRLKEKHNAPDRRFRRFPELYKMFDLIQPDILFIHGCQFLDTGVVKRYLSVHPNVEVYVDNHADFTNSATSWLSKNILHRIVWRHCAQKLLPYVEKFYGVLPARVDFLTDIYKLPQEKCELLVMGADDELVEKAAQPEVRSSIRKQYGIGEDDFLIINGGKIDMAKKQTLLLMDAVNKINRTNVKLIVFGSVIPELKDEVENRQSNQVRYIGWVAAEKTYDYFASADLAVFPGRHSVFWEQVAGQGIPMLVKDWPGTHHVDVGGNVKFLTQDTAEEIKHHIDNLTEHPDEYQQMKAVAMSDGRIMFSYKDIAERSISRGRDS